MLKIQSRALIVVETAEVAHIHSESIASVLDAQASAAHIINADSVHADDAGVALRLDVVFVAEMFFGAVDGGR